MLEYQHYSGGQSSNLNLSVLHFLTPLLIRHLWQLNTVVFMHWCFVCALLLKELLDNFCENMP
jgi:hypothetical protein